ncbi:hypothetical protein IBX73_06055 [candidate division WOR-3 bacterium]|nr:hypothetical protein [candidate division WOR-3 bacterium]
MMLVIVVAVFTFVLLRRGERCIILSEVIPEGEVVSEVEGIIEYQGVRYLLGTNDLKTKKHLLQKLDLLDISDTLTVDMRYAGQIIVRRRSGRDVLRRK